MTEAPESFTQPQERRQRMQAAAALIAALAHHHGVEGWYWPRTVELWTPNTVELVRLALLLGDRERMGARLLAKLGVTSPTVSGDVVLFMQVDESAHTAEKLAAHSKGTAPLVKQLCSVLRLWQLEHEATVAAIAEREGTIAADGVTLLTEGAHRLKALRGLISTGESCALVPVWVPAGPGYSKYNANDLTTELDMAGVPLPRWADRAGFELALEQLPGMAFAAEQFADHYHRAARKRLLERLDSQLSHMAS